MKLTDKKSSPMRDGFEQQRNAGVNVDWFTWQIAWHEALFTQCDIAGDAAPAAPQQVAKPAQEIAQGDERAQTGIFSPFNACMYREDCRARATALQAQPRLSDAAHAEGNSPPITGDRPQPYAWRDTGALETGEA